ncbi:hypothetical protein JJC04_06150 [Flavobacterium covae]|uniref:hypothetical protein n=1 Tax=Flavobacterium covae TaxID=2906076 RepID=UPI00193105AB|nr:hypothetical protein [Flavobacterium covae]QYS92148.1 hypothetical protein JJC04_06150 [Flavobacterium covae]
MLKIQLVYREEALGEAWKNDFADCQNVEIISGDILQIPSDLWMADSICISQKL